MIPIAKPLIGDEEKKAVAAVLDSGMIASGDEVRAFEQEYAAYLGIEHCIATNSGTTALEIGLRALGIGAGDKVLTTPFSFIASTNSILYTGATPVFADISPDTFNVSAETVERALQRDPGIKGLLIVHLFGQPCDMDQIMPLVEKYQLLLIEDCAQAHAALWKGKPVGTFGDVGCFSFYPTKNMTTSEGGAIITGNAEIAERCRLLINHGMKVRYHHDLIGYNARMTNIAAAIGRCQLQKLAERNRIRCENAAYLNSRITNDRILKPVIRPDAAHVFHQYTIRVLNGRRAEFLKLLEEKGIGYGVFYPLSIPEQHCYDAFHFGKAFPVTDQIKQEVVSLPVHPALKRSDLDQIVEAVTSFI